MYIQVLNEYSTVYVLRIMHTCVFSRCLCFCHCAEPEPQLQGETDLDEMVATGPPFEQETEKLTSPKQFIHVQQRSADLDAVTVTGVEGSDVDTDTVVGVLL